MDQNGTRYRGGIDWQSMVWIAISKDSGVYWDLSSESEYTLSVSTQQLLHELDAPLDIVVFEAQQSRSDAALRDRYTGGLNETIGAVITLVKWRLENLDKERDLAQRLGVTQYGAIALTWKGVTLVIPERKMFLTANGTN